MEISYEEAQILLKKRFNEYPEIKALVESREFRVTLANIVSFEKVDASLLPTIENEILVLLAFYTTISQLGKNIAESTGLPLEVSENIAIMVDSLLLSDIRNELEAFEFFWNQELQKAALIPQASKDLREKLELRPQGQPVVGVPVTNQQRPLTREEVLHSLSLRRTMATDIQSMKDRTNTPPLQNPNTGNPYTTSNP